MEDNTYRDLSCILMQELYENGLFDINEITKKYRMNKEFKMALQEIYHEYFPDEEE